MKSSLLLIAILPAWLCHCTTLQQIIGISVNPPTVKMEEARLKSISWTEMEFVLKLSLDNKNKVDLVFEDLVYKVELYGIELTEGKFSETVTAKGKSVTEVEIPLRVPVQKTAEIVQKLFADVHQESELVLTGEASFVTDMGGIKVDFEERKPLLR